MNLEDIKRQLDENSIKIINNMNKIHQNSGALEILKDFKDDNKRMFILNLILIGIILVLGTFTLYILKDTGTAETTESIEIEDVETIDNTHIKIGDDVWEKLE